MLQMYVYQFDPLAEINVSPAEVSIVKRKARQTAGRPAIPARGRRDAQATICGRGARPVVTR